MLHRVMYNEEIHENPSISAKSDIITEITVVIVTNKSLIAMCWMMIDDDHVCL